MNAQVTGFRFVLGSILVSSVIASAVWGGVLGAASAALTGGDIGTCALIGAVVSGFIGWILGAYVHGIGYTLLSIDDRLGDIAAALKGTAPAGTPTTAPAMEQSAPSKPGTASDAATVPTFASWRERLEALPVDQSVEINGLLASYKVRQGKPPGTIEWE